MLFSKVDGRERQTGINVLFNPPENRPLQHYTDDYVPVMPLSKVTISIVQNDG
jgi:hypothetical protein